MSHNHDLLAKKYACAFLNLYHTQLSDWYFDNLMSLGVFLKNNSWIFVYLSIPTVDYEIKQKVIHRVGESLQFCHHTSILINTLLKHNRIELLGSVIKQIQIRNRTQKNIEVFTVKTSHDLDDEQKNSIIDFIKKITSSHITVQFLQDPSLIVGLKIQSDVHRWERSVARQLRDIEQNILRQVSL